MNKTFRILQLINLLYNRQYVTLKMIEKTCDIPERTVYRYMTTISEANIPVYYDETHRAYSLSRRPSTKIDDLNLNEAVILALALRTLRRQVNKRYRKAIDRLTTKVLVRQNAPVEASIPSMESQLDAHEPWNDLSPVLSRCLLGAAIAAGRTVRVETHGDAKHKESVNIEMPSLLFDKSWQITDKSGQRGAGADLEDIENVSIL